MLQLLFFFFPARNEWDISIIRKQVWQKLGSSLLELFVWENYGNCDASSLFTRESGAGLGLGGRESWDAGQPGWPAAAESSLAAQVTVRLKYFTTIGKNSHCFSHFCDKNLNSDTWALVRHHSSPTFGGFMMSSWGSRAERDVCVVAKFEQRVCHIPTLASQSPHSLTSIQNCEQNLHTTNNFGVCIVMFPIHDQSKFSVLCPEWSFVIVSLEIIQIMQIISRSGTDWMWQVINQQKKESVENTRFEVCTTPTFLDTLRYWNWPTSYVPFTLVVDVVDCVNSWICSRL